MKIEEMKFGLESNGISQKEVGIMELYRAMFISPQQTI